MSGDCRLVHAPHRADSRIASLCSATLRSGFWDSSCASFIRNSSGRLEYFSSVDATKRRSFGNPARARFCARVCVCVCVCVCTGRDCTEATMFPRLIRQWSERKNARFSKRIARASRNISIFPRKFARALYRIISPPSKICVHLYI